jgi:hypothetical protein
MRLPSYPDAIDDLTGRHDVRGMKVRRAKWPLEMLGKENKTKEEIL